MKRLVALLLFLPLVSAIPEIGHQFYGDVDGDIPDGAQILAIIDGIEYGSAEIDDGRYGYEDVFFVPADDPDTTEKEGGVNGDTIEFYLEDEKLGEYEYSNRETTKLDFEIYAESSGSQPDITEPDDNTTSSNRKDDESDLLSTECIYRWDCSAWSVCIDGKQTRSCTNAGTCPDDYERPSESVACVVASCSDGIRNQDETDVDCGGSCAKCSNEKRCRLNSDCDSGYCLDKICYVKQAENPPEDRYVEPKPIIEETCFDGIQNQDEINVDCGGVCDPCKKSILPIILVVSSIIVLAAIAAGVFLIYKKRSSLQQ